MKITAAILVALAATAAARPTYYNCNAAKDWAVGGNFGRMGIAKFTDGTGKCEISTNVPKEGFTAGKTYTATVTTVGKRYGIVASAGKACKKTSGRASSAKFTFTATGESMTLKALCGGNFNKKEMMVVAHDIAAASEEEPATDAPAEEPLCSEKTKCTGSDENGKCAYNKYTKTCQNAPVTKPACEEITNFYACKFGCAWNKKDKTCFTVTKRPTKPLVPCEDRKICTGSDAVGRCYKSIWTGACQVGKPTKPACDAITNFRLCNKGCFWDKTAKECSVATKRPTGAPTEAPLCSEKKFCTGSDVNGRCYYNKYTETCGNEKPAKPACDEITNFRLCNKGCFWSPWKQECSDTKPAKPACDEIVNPKYCKFGCVYDKKAETCSTVTKRPTGAPTEAPLCSEKKYCTGSDVNGRCYFNKWTKACSNAKPVKPACDAIVNIKACNFGCFWNKWTASCGAQKAAKPASCADITDLKYCNYGCEKQDGECVAQTPCAEREKCTGYDEAGRCFKSKFTDACQAGTAPPKDCSAVKKEFYCKQLKKQGCHFTDGACVQYGAVCASKGFKDNCEKQTECAWKPEDAACKLSKSNNKLALKGSTCCFAGDMP